MNKAAYEIPLKRFCFINSILSAALFFINNSGI